jgi:hypothetical protein
VLTVPGLSGMACYGTTGVNSIIPAEGIAEQVGDVVFNCTGGTTTPVGQPIPEYTITYKLNTNITSRRLQEGSDLSEALLTINEPFPANPVPWPFTFPPYDPPQILCTPIGSYCPATGTGTFISPTQPNVFVGKQTGVDSLEWKVPIDPPGVSGGTRVIRLTNVRANASLIGASTTLLPNQLFATVAIQTAQPVPVVTPGQLPVAVLVPSVSGIVPSSPQIAQCQPHNAALLGKSGTAAFDFTIAATEIYAYSFKYRNYGTELDGFGFPPTLVEQNIFGFNYNDETGLYSPSLFTSTPTLGLADSGMRIRIALGPVSAGTHLFVPTTITMTGAYGEGSTQGRLQLVQADENGKSTPGYEPIEATAMVGTTPVAEVKTSGTTAYAIYEVIYSNPAVTETATIPVAVAFTNKPATGLVISSTSLAPLGTNGNASESAPIPRFANFSTPQGAYSITSCSAQ